MKREITKGRIKQMLRMWNNGYSIERIAECYAMTLEEVKNILTPTT